MSDLNRIVPQVKELSAQTPGPLVVIAANGVSSPIYAHEYEIIDDVFVAYGELIGDTQAPLYACHVSEARFYAAEILNLKSVEQLTREAIASNMAQQRLQNELLTPLTLMPEAQTPQTDKPGLYL